MKSPLERIAEAVAAISDLTADLRRHETMLADAKRARAHTDEVREIEVLIANDHSLIASWERIISKEEQNASDPALIELRKRVAVLTFEECVVALISRDDAGPLSVPMKDAEGLAHLRGLVFEGARSGRLTLPAQPAQKKTRQARRLPLIETRTPAATSDADRRNGTVNGPTPSPMADETITNSDGDWWTCVCGNEPWSDGFHACDIDGNEVEPVRGWCGLYVCATCGRIIDPDTLRVVGRNPEPRMLDD